jgi:acyl-CoA thioesterase-2
MRLVTEIQPGEFPVLHPLWVRTAGRLPDDPALHACALTFMSDMGVVGSARAPTSTLPKRFIGASLDHAVWFHRPVRADEWLLFSVEPVTNYASRGLARGTFHTADGVHVASVAQEALLRSTGRTPLP